jgi:hypothetical protein
LVFTLAHGTALGQPTPPAPAPTAPGISAPASPAPAAPAARTDEPPPAPETLTAKDRILFNAGLDALVIGDFNQARSLFVLIAQKGETPEARLTASVIVDRIGGVEHRRAAGLLPPLKAPADVGLTARPVPVRTRRPDTATARAPVVTTTTALGLALWGWTLPDMLGVNASQQPRAFLGLYMLTATAAFAVPYMLTAEKPPTPAQANLIFYGGTRGAEFGLLLSNLVFGRAGGDFDSNDRAFSTSLLLGSVAGTVAGAYLPPRLSLSPGDVRTMAVLGDYGLFAGFALGRLFGFHELGKDEAPQFAGFEPVVSQSVLDRRARATAAAGLVGSGLGLLGGRLLTLRRNNTWGDGEVMRAAGILGLFTAATVANGTNIGESNPDALPAILAAGTGVGLFAGDFLVRTTAFTPGESLLVDLALVSGGLGGAGLTYLVADSLSDTAYLFSATAGAAISGGLVAWALGQRRSGEETRDEALAGGPRVALLPRLDPGGPKGLQLVGSF